MLNFEMVAGKLFRFEVSGDGAGPAGGHPGLLASSFRCNFADPRNRSKQRLSQDNTVLIN